MRSYSEKDLKEIEGKYQPQPLRPVQIEKTSKFWKGKKLKHFLINLFSIFGIFIGLLLWGFYGEMGKVILTISGLIFLYSFVSLIVAYIGSWWDHG